jgi:hypothetical protein
MRENKYTSAKGDTFLNWDQWAHQTLSEADLAIYLNSGVDGEPMVPEKLALYARWVAEEQILTHTVEEDGVVIQHSDEL